MTRLSKEEVEKWKAVAVQDRDYHSRQFDEPYRSTVSLLDFIRSVLDRPEGEALDVACGSGANIYHLGRGLPGYKWTGVDIVGEALFTIARQRFGSLGAEAPSLIEGDLNDLVGLFPGRQFDLVLAIQTLTCLPSYEAALDQLLKVTRGWLFVTGLFTDFRVDAWIQASDYTWPETSRGVYRYNIYDVERVRAFCEARGSREFVTRDFEIDIDLEVPESKGLASYTRMLADGKRLQFTGPLFLPWKFIGIRMGSSEGAKGRAP